MIEYQSRKCGKYESILWTENGYKQIEAAPVEKLPETIDLDKATDAEHGLELEAKVEEVEGEEAKEVDVERGRVHVVLPQLHTVRLKHPVLQVG